MNINQSIVSSHQIPTDSSGQKISQIQQHPQANTISNSPSQVIYDLYKQPSNQASNGPQRANLPLENNLNIITHNQKNQQQSCVQNFGNNCNPQNHHLSFAGHSQQNTRTPYNSAQCSAEGVLSSQNPFLSFGISAPSKQNFGYSNSSQNVHPLTNVDNPWAHTLMATTQNSWIWVRCCFLIVECYYWFPPSACSLTSHIRLTSINEILKIYNSSTLPISTI